MTMMDIPPLMAELVMTRRTRQRAPLHPMLMPMLTCPGRELQLQSMRRQLLQTLVMTLTKQATATMGCRAVLLLWHRRQLAAAAVERVAHVPVAVVPQW